MISLKTTTLLGVLLTTSLLGACGQPSQDAATDAPQPEETAIATDSAPATEATDEATEKVAKDSTDPVAKFINAPDGVAIKGTDPVAYFTESKPVAGSEQFAHEWNGVQWHFSSAENRDLFAADPEKYAPQYGGHCAWAAAEGYVADIDPTAWSVVDGRLFLNFNASVQRQWEQDIPGFIAAADEKWPSVVADNS